MTDRADICKRVVRVPCRARRERCSRPVVTIGAGGAIRAALRVSDRRERRGAERERSAHQHDEQRTPTAATPSRASRGARRAHAQAFFASGVAVPIVIFFGCDSGFFGTSTVRTPSRRSAWIRFESTPSGNVNARVKLPYVRSYA